MAHFSVNNVVSLCLAKLSALYNQPVVLKSSQMLGGGCINQAARINTSVGDFFVKWNASAPAGIFVKEAAGLIEMKQHENTFLKIPEVIWNKETDDLPGLLLLEYLQPASSTTGFDERLGRGIAQLHCKTARQFGFHHDNFCGTTVQNNLWTSNWPEFYAQRRIWQLVQQIKSTRRMTLEDLKTYEKLVDRMPLVLPHETVPSLIHGDLWSGNYMYTADGPAVIDPACYYADREMELGMMKLFGGFSVSVWEAYQEEFPLPNGWKERIHLYQLYHVLNHYLLFGGSYGWQALEIAREYL
jgi:fructosamine-3-kinase